MVFILLDLFTWVDTLRAVLFLPLNFFFLILLIFFAYEEMSPRFQRTVFLIFSLAQPYAFIFCHAQNSL